VVAQLKAAGESRGRGQIMADTLVERVTGQTSAVDVSAEIQIVVPHQALSDAGDAVPSEVRGRGVGVFGQLPAPLAREIVDATAGDVFWRRLITESTSDSRQVVVGIDRRRRRFSGSLADLIDARDGQRCRDPYCSAPIRHHDHIHRFTDGGSTTDDNGRGVCQRGNLVREMPGWTVRLIDADTHTVETVTPTGHRYRSRPPEPP